MRHLEVSWIHELIVILFVSGILLSFRSFNQGRGRDIGNKHNTTNAGSMTENSDNNKNSIKCVIVGDGAVGMCQCHIYIFYYWKRKRIAPSR